MTDDTMLPFAFPAVRGRKITADFDGGRLTSDGGVMLLAMAERRLGIAARLARLVPDRRDPTRITHTLADMVRARIFAIAMGYEDADDLDHPRHDPAFKLARGRMPDSGDDLCSQPTLSRLENAPGLRDVIRLTYALVDAWMASYPSPPRSVTLDIDDTCDVVHGHQQLSLFNAHYDDRCFLPIHVYDTAASRPVAVVLRPGKTPSGVEVRGHLRRLVRRIRTRWPTTRILFRGDSHYARPEAMAWCENNNVDYVFGPRRIEAAVGEDRGNGGRGAHRTRRRRQADRARLRRDAAQGQILGSRTPRHRTHRGNAARPRHPLRRHQPAFGSAQWLYDSLYCARGQAENLIKLHKTQLASDRTSCRSACANQMRLVLHTAAYWLMLAVRDAIPKIRDLAKAEFATLRLRLLKVAARVIETAGRIRIAFAAACPEADLFRSMPDALWPAAP